MPDDLQTVVFLSYSNARQDATWLDALHKHLDVFVSQGMVEVWFGGRTSSGSNVEAQRAALRRAQVAIILLSPDYLTAPELKEERQLLFDAADRGELTIHILVVQHCVYDVVPSLAGRQVFDRQPLMEMSPGQAERRLGDLARLIARPPVSTGSGPPQLQPEERAYTDGQVRLGIITALPKEYAAVKKMLDDIQDVTKPGGRRYLRGILPASGGGRHEVVLSMLPTMANNPAAIRATQLFADFPNVRDVIMTGIAGGVPDPDHPETHVRLGDIVVSGDHGIVQYDLVKDTLSSREMHRELTPRSPPRPPSRYLLEAVRLLEAEELAGMRPWLAQLLRANDLQASARPSQEGDLLGATPPRDGWIPHPEDPLRVAGQARIFVGKIASGNTLLKNAVVRDELRRRHGVRAVEMEASGVADAAWSHEAGYLVVRGICDYCDEHKNDDWQGHAAVAAAAYVRALLGSMPVNERP